MILEGMSLALAVNTTEEMFELLSYSSRCISDIKRQIDYAKLLPKWSFYIIIRKFKYIPLCNEFRCFIYNNKLTAATQYFQNCYFSKLLNHRNDYWNLIQTFYNETLLTNEDENNNNNENNENTVNNTDVDTLPCQIPSSCVLDLNVDLESGKVMIIELNPFSPTTGSGFFHWEKDKLLLQGGVVDNDVVNDDIDDEGKKDKNMEMNEQQSISYDINDVCRVREEEDIYCDNVLLQWSDILKELQGDRSDDDFEQEQGECFTTLNMTPLTPSCIEHEGEDACTLCSIM